MMSEDKIELVSVVIEMECYEAFAPEGFTVRGDNTRAAWLNLIAGIDPSSAEECHNFSGYSTTSQLYDSRKYRNFFSRLLKIGPRHSEKYYLIPAHMPAHGKHYCFRVTLMHIGKNALLEENRERIIGEALWVGDSATGDGFAFRVRNIYLTPDRFPVGRRLLIPSDSPENTPHNHEAFSDNGITLFFFSPTTFRDPYKTGNNINITFPDPELVFESIFMRWFPLFGKSLDDYYALESMSESDSLRSHIKKIARHVRISKYRLSTEAPQVIGRGTEIGFTGYVTYDFGLLNREDRCLFRRLGGFALFSGIGSRRAMGLGQTFPLFRTEHGYSL